MKKKRRQSVKLPDARADAEALVKNSRRDLKESLEKPAALDNLAGLTQALKKAKGKKK